MNLLLHYCHEIMHHWFGRVAEESCKWPEALQAQWQIQSQVATSLSMLYASFCTHMRAYGSTLTPGATDCPCVDLYMLTVSMHGCIHIFLTHACTYVHACACVSRTMLPVCTMCWCLHTYIHTYVCIVCIHAITYEIVHTYVGTYVVSINVCL